MEKKFVSNNGIELKVYNHPQYGRSIELRKVVKVKLKSSVSTDTTSGISSLSGLISPYTEVEETRVMFDNVSSALKDKSDEEVLQIYLNTLNEHNLHLTKISSLYPILTPKVKMAIEGKFLTKEDVADKQKALKKTDNGELVPALYNGHEFYTVNVLKVNELDQDLRDLEIQNMSEVQGF